MAKKYSTGFIIGRFQPFHNGHDYLVKKSLRIVDKLIIGIGSSNIKNNNNPLSYSQRKEILAAYIEKEKLESKIIKIISLPDCPDDNDWFDSTIKKTGKIDLVIGNNDWVNGIFEKKKIKILRVAYYKRFIFEGEKIRKLISENQQWENRVPGFLVQKIKGTFLQN